MVVVSYHTEKVGRHGHDHYFELVDGRTAELEPSLFLRSSHLKLQAGNRL